MLQIFIISLAALSIEAIKVPVERADTNVTKTAPVLADQVIPIYYVSDAANIDSYLIPPDPHKPEDANHQKVPTPATHLLPPAPDAKNEYYFKSTEPGEQSDWYPIVAAPQKQTKVIPLRQEDDRPQLQEVLENLRTGKVLDGGHVISLPPRNLLPPRENAPNDFVVLSPSVELELPSEEIDHTLNNSPINNIQLPVVRDPLKYPMKYPIKPNQIPVSYITPPRNIAPEYRNPTRLYPKKYHSEFIPVPIPVSEFADASIQEMPIENPAKPLDTAINDLLSEVPPAEQEASETNYGYPGRDEYSVALKPTHNVFPNGIKSKGERTEFRMHGMKGPHSYQFGYDTGKGKNRQFRYEERDNDGHVRGHYGYVDKLGKLRVVNYDADPEHGFRAELPVEKE